MKIGITGQAGFVGWHLYHSILLRPKEFDIVEFSRSFFDSEELLDQFVSSCDAIVHLAAVNRHESQESLYAINVALTDNLIASLKRTKSKPYVLFSSSSQEERDNLYGKSKQICRKKFQDWATENEGTFCGMIIPNVFGPFCKPNYNSFIATFCHRLCHGEQPVIEVDSEVNLIYVGELVDTIIGSIKNKVVEPLLKLSPSSVCKVAEVLRLLNYYKESYFEKGEIPILNNKFEVNLFNTFRSYIDLETHFPVKLEQHIDNRGVFVETIRLGIGGQCSFSTTAPEITRGNHYHTRKIERFTVIKGNALIQLRKVGSKQVFNFNLSGKEPAYVDMPIWYTHNVKNTGTEDLYLIFWINEAYDSSNPDTYFENV